MLPIPTEKHQRILEFIFLIIREVMQSIGGRAFFCLCASISHPVPTVSQISCLRSTNMIHGVPIATGVGADLVLEVVSPDNPERDRVRKRTDYAQAGIPEYWIVDPQQEQIAVLRLDGDQYVEYGLVTVVRLQHRRCCPICMLM